MKSHSLQSGVLRNVFPIGEERHTKLGEIDVAAKRLFPFYFQLPYDDPIELLKWRIYARRRCATDHKFREAIWEMCRKDVAFFCVTFLVVFEPRPRPRWLPFFLWTDQVSVLAWMQECYGVRSMAVNKTRGIGFSWLSAAFLFHKWVFDTECKIAVITEDETKLDGPDSNSSIGKLQYLFDYLPAWAKTTKSGSLKLKRGFEKHTFVNIENAAVVQGYVSRAQKLRQLRFTIIFADEFAFYDNVDQEEWVVSANGCTNNLLIGSTWNAFDDMFHHIMHEEKSSLLKAHFFWWNNTERWKGAYKVKSGQVELIDKEYKHSPDYQFGQPDVLEEGMLRSPWVDAELAQPGKRRNILKALRDLYGMEVCASTNSFFDSNTLRFTKESITEPTVQGMLDTSKDKVEILPTTKGNIRVWGDLPDLSKGPFTAFCDLSHGVQAAYSVMQVLDKHGNHCLEYGTNDTVITDFAKNVVLICRWLAGENGDNWVLLDFEANGMPKPFYTEVVRMDYGNLFMSDRKHPKKSKDESLKYYGTSSRDGGLASFRELERAVLALETRILSQKVLSDMVRCDKDHEKNGQPKFSANHQDGHGDFVQAFAGAWWRARHGVELASMVESTDIQKDIRHSQPWERLTSTRWSDFWR